MDKHQRRQLRKRDEKLGEIKELYAKNLFEAENRKKTEVFEALSRYSGRVSSDFVAFCLEQEEVYHGSFFYASSRLEWLWDMEDNYNHIWRYWHNDMPRFRRITIWKLLQPQRKTVEELLMENSAPPFYEERICGHNVLVLRGGSIDVRASISNGKQLLDKRVTRTHAIELLRTKRRTDKFRKELIARCERMRPILNFKHIKEELMMVAWHPRRIERILELGGWEALDNFAGC